MPNPLASLTPLLAALAAVLALILVAGRVVRSTGLNRAQQSQRPVQADRIAILDTLMLDRTRRLHVVRWDGRDLVLLTGGATDQVIGWVPPGERP